MMRWLRELVSRAQGLLGQPSGQTPYVSTRRRLALINLAVVSAIVALMAGTIYVVEEQSLHAQVQAELVDHAQATTPDAAQLLEHSTASGATPPTGSTPDSGDEGDHYLASSPNVFTLVMTSSGAVAADPNGVQRVGLPDQSSVRNVLAHARAGSASPCLSSHLGTHSGEFALYTCAVHADNPTGPVIGAVQVGVSLAPEEARSHQLALVLIGVALGALLLTAAASLFLADRALLPMRQAYDRQRQFSAAASHELRTPLAFVRSQLDLIARRLQRVEAGNSGAQANPAQLMSGLREDVSDTLDEVDYMTRLVRDLLLMARDAADHRTIAWEPVDLNETLLDALETVRPAAVERGVTLEEGQADAPLWVTGDGDRLRQLFLILLDNAVRYTPTGGRVWTQARVNRHTLPGRMRQQAQVTISDTGVGIAPELHERIFEPFYRAGGHTADAHGDHGSGLGLSLARWLASAHEGTIAVASAPGEGAAFTVSLPLLADKRSRFTESAPHPVVADASRQDEAGVRGIGSEATPASNANTVA